MAFLYKALAHNLEKWGWVKLAIKGSLPLRSGLAKRKFHSVPSCDDGTIPYGHFWSRNVSKSHASFFFSSFWDDIVLFSFVCRDSLNLSVFQNKVNLKQGKPAINFL